MKPDLSRVVAIGTSCSGKTAYSRRLSRLLGSRHVELDALHWLPGWVPREPADFRALLAEATAEESWVIDGNYGSVRELIWPRATAAVWLNYAFPTIMWRGLARTVTRSLRREELYAGNRETIRNAFFSRRSILGRIATTFGPRRSEYRALFDRGAYADLALIEFRRPADAEEFLSNVSPAPSASRRRSSCGASGGGGRRSR